MTEGELRGATNSEGEWCQRLYENQAAKLVLYGRALGFSRTEAEDILQETFIRLLELEECPEEPTYYAFRAFRNQASNYRRTLWRRLKRELESFRWFERNNDETPVERAAMRCLARLPREQQEVIVLKIWSEFTFEQIGALLQISPNTVAGRYRYGMEKLRTALKGKQNEQFEIAGDAIEGLETTPTLA